MAAVEVTWNSGFVIDYFQGAAARALVDLAYEAQGIAYYIAPFRTGTFRDSIEVELGADKLTVTLASHVFYSGFLEYGTSKMAARPTFRLVLMDLSQRMVPFLAQAMREQGIGGSAAGAANEFGDFPVPEYAPEF